MQLKGKLCSTDTVFGFIISEYIDYSTLRNVNIK